ncbi:hypothetical protein, partial [Cupriavidus taiwanensis]|uniref:hypothetical protein n=1 Tax=Cupriavidus taiwanensis TaxID=164546 RepID=UPI0039C08F0F
SRLGGAASEDGAAKEKQEKTLEHVGLDEKRANIPTGMRPVGGEGNVRLYNRKGRCVWDAVGAAMLAGSAAIVERAGLVAICYHVSVIRRVGELPTPAFAKRIQVQHFAVHDLRCCVEPFCLAVLVEQERPGEPRRT